MIQTLPVVEECSDCSACCNQHSLPPYSRVMILDRDLFDEWPFEDDEIIEWFDELPDELKNELTANVDRSDKPCLWLNNGKCRHYEQRPPACRAFPVDGKWCHIHRREAGIETRP